MPLLPIEALEALEKADVFAFDFETVPKPGLPDDAALDVTKCDVDGLSVAVHVGNGKIEAWDCDIPIGSDFLVDLRPFLKDRKKTAIVHNLPFEGGIIHHNYGGWIPECNRWDTQVSAHVCDENLNDADYPQGGYGLKERARRDLGMTMMEFKEAKNYRFSLYHEERAQWSHYRQADSAAAMGLKLIHERVLNHEGTTKVFTEMEMPAADIITEMQLCPISMDLRALRKYRDEYKIKRAEHEKTIHTLAGFKFDPGSSGKLADVLYNKMGFPTKDVPWGKKGGPSTNKLAIRILQTIQPHPILNEILEWRHYDHDLTAFWEPNLVRASRNDGCIRPDIIQTAQVSGRWSFVEPCVTQFPRGSTSPFREAVIAKPGFVLLDADYSQAELRVMAHRSGDKELTRCYAEGLDVHQITADSVGCSRNRAKGVNFGYLYGMWPKRFCEQVLEDSGAVLSIQEATKFREGYFNTYWGVGLYHKKVEDQLKDLGYVEDIFGRRRHLQDLKRVNFNRAIRQAINSTIQTSVASLIKLAMIRLRQRWIDKGWWGRDGAHFLFQVHDSIVPQVPEEIAVECAADMYDVMVNTVQLRVPLHTDVKIGKRWASRDLEKNKGPVDGMIPVSKWIELRKAA